MAFVVRKCRSCNIPINYELIYPWRNWADVIIITSFFSRFGWHLIYAVDIYGILNVAR